MKSILLYSLFILCAVCTRAEASLFKSESFKLDNGLEVIVIENHRAPVVTHMVWYKTGAIDDPLGKSGIAHVLEHMMFKGTEKIPEGEFSRIIARNGGRENAFTTQDYTAYYQNIAKDRLELVMFMEADRMRNLHLKEQDFIPELEVVKEERLMRTDNNPAAILSERKNKTLWGEHPYGRPVIGTRKELASLQLNDAEQFYKTRYAPDNAILIVAGDITAKELKPLAEKYYGTVAPERTALEQKKFPSFQTVKAKIEMKHPQVKVKTLARNYIVPSYVTDKTKAHTYAVLAEMLGTPHVGLLYKHFVAQDKTASHAGASYDGFSLDKGTFTLYAVPQNGQTLEKLEQTLDEFLSSRHLTQAELDKAKIRMVAGMEYINDSPENAANLVGQARVIGLTVDDLQNWTDNIQKTTLQDVRNALADMIENAPSATTYLMPEDKKQ